QLLVMLGVRGAVAFGVVVVLVGILIAYLERRKHIPIRGRYFGWLVLESAAYALVVALVIGTLVGWMFALMQSGPLTSRRPDFFTMLALSIGAGLYEELIFRVILVGGLYLIIRTFYPTGAYAAAAISGAIIFSGVHYIGPLGDPFMLHS